MSSGCPTNNSTWKWCWITGKPLFPEHHPVQITWRHRESTQREWRHRENDVWLLQTNRYTWSSPQGVFFHENLVSPARHISNNKQYHDHCNAKRYKNDTFVKFHQVSMVWESSSSVYNKYFAVFLRNSKNQTHVFHKLFPKSFWVFCWVFCWVSRSISRPILKAYVVSSLESQTVDVRDSLLSPPKHTHKQTNTHCIAMWHTQKHTHHEPTTRSESGRDKFIQLEKTRCASFKIFDKTILSTPNKNKWSTSSKPTIKSILTVSNQPRI